VDGCLPHGLWHPQASTALVIFYADWVGLVGLAFIVLEVMRIMKSRNTVGQAHNVPFTLLVRPPHTVSGRWQFHPPLIPHITLPCTSTHMYIVNMRRVRPSHRTPHHLACTHAHSYTQSVS